jgi:hypothetical protein
MMRLADPIALDPPDLLWYECAYGSLKRRADA